MSQIIRAEHVQSEADLERKWLIGSDRIGLTAGTSTPDETVDAVEIRLRELMGGFCVTNARMSRFSRVRIDTWLKDGE